MLDYINNNIVILCLTVFTFILLVKADSLSRLIRFYISYRKGLKEAKSKYAKFSRGSDVSVYKLIHLYKLLERYIDCETAWTKCPNCNVKTWQLAEGNHTWIDLKDSSYLCKCLKCKHISLWLEGPGIMLSVNDGLDKEDQKALAEKFRQLNEKV